MIIVTRPHPYGEELTARFIEQGLCAYHRPFFKIKFTLDMAMLIKKLTTLKSGDKVIITSPQVINALQSEQASQYFPHHITYFAVGASTAQLAQSRLGLTVNYPTDHEDSEGLIALPALEHIAEQQVLILRGEYGRELIYQTLQARGAQVEYLTCYARQPIIYQPRELFADQVDTLFIVTSSESLEHLSRLLLKKQKQQAKLIVSSIRLQQQAQNDDWPIVISANSANNQILFKTTLTLCHNKTQG